MIRKLLSLVLILNTVSMAQNLQLHYELSEDRQYVLSTLEMFKPDNYGATFWFVDMEYNSTGVKNANLAYWEIARYFNTPVNNLSATLQYNDGVAADFPLGLAWLAGVSYYVDLGFVALPVDVLYRHAEGASSADFQVTVTWLKTFMDDHLEFAGFFDLWSQDEFGTSDKQLVLLGEPQLWYHANEHLSIGTEVEISKNFVFGADGVQALPTIGLRWNF